MAVLGEVVTLLTLDDSGFHINGKRAVEIFKEISNSSRATRTAVNAVGSTFGTISGALSKAGDGYEDLANAAKGFQTVASGIASGGILGGAIAGGVLLINQFAEGWNNAKKAAQSAIDTMQTRTVENVFKAIKEPTEMLEAFTKQEYALQSQLIGSTSEQQKVIDAFTKQQEKVSTLHEGVAEEIGFRERQKGRGQKSGIPSEQLIEYKLQEGVLKRLDEAYQKVYSVRNLSTSLEAQKKQTSETENLVKKSRELTKEYEKQQRIQKIQLPTGPMNLQSGELFPQKSLVGGLNMPAPVRMQQGLGTELGSPLLQAANQATVDPAIAKAEAEERRKLELVAVKALVGARGLDGFIVALTKFPNFTKLAGDALSTFSGSISDLFGTTGADKTTGALGGGLGGLGGAATKLIPMAGPIIDAAAMEVSIALGALTESISMVTDSIGNILSTIVDFAPIGKLAKDALTGISDVYVNGFEKLGKAFSGDPIAFITGPLVGWQMWGDALNTGISIFGDLISQTESYKTVQQGIENITSRVITAFEPLMEVFYPVIGIFSVLADLITKLIAPFMQTGLIMSLLYNTTKLTVLNLLVVIHTFYRFQSTIALVASTLFKWVNDLTGGLAFTQEMKDWGETYNNAIGGMIDTAIAFDTINSSTMESMWDLGKSVGTTDEEFKKLNSSITNMPRWYRTALAITNAGSAPTNNNKPGSSNNQSFVQTFNIETVTVGDPSSFANQVAATASQRAYRTTGTKREASRSAKG